MAQRLFDCNEISAALSLAGRWCNRTLDFTDDIIHLIYQDAGIVVAESLYTEMIVQCALSCSSTSVFRSIFYRLFATKHLLQNDEAEYRPICKEDPLRTEKGIKMDQITISIYN